MSERVVDIGDKLHIITRRRFDGDVRRHFAGEVTGCTGDLYELRGYEFVFSSGSNEYKRRPELRTRLFSLGEEGFIVTKISRHIDIESLEYRFLEKRRVVTDRKAFTLDINEF